MPFKYFIISLSFLYYLYFRYLLNDACVLAGKPLVSGSALRFEGQVLCACMMNFIVGDYRGAHP